MPRAGRVRSRGGGGRRPARRAAPSFPSGGVPRRSPATGRLRRRREWIWSAAAATKKRPEEGDGDGTTRRSKRRAGTGTKEHPPRAAPAGAPPREPRPPVRLRPGRTGARPRALLHFLGGALPGAARREGCATARRRATRDHRERFERGAPELARRESVRFSDARDLRCRLGGGLFDDRRIFASRSVGRSVRATIAEGAGGAPGAGAVQR